MKAQLKKKLESPKIFPSNKESSLILSSNIITTPSEKVLTILNEAKNFIQNHSKGQYALIASLEWAIEVITSRSLYSYEFKEKEKVKKLSEENPEFKELVDFVSEYNEKVLTMSRKYNHILTDKLLQKPSINLNKKKIKRKSSFTKESTKNSNVFDLIEEENSTDNIEPSHTETKNIINDNPKSDPNIPEFNYLEQNNNLIYKSNNSHDILINNNISENKINNNIKKKQVNNKKKNKQLVNINDEIEDNESEQGLEFLKGYFKAKAADINKEIRKKSLDKKSKNKFIFFPSVQKISITINNNDLSKKNNYSLSNDLIKENKYQINPYNKQRRYSSNNMVNIYFNGLNKEKELDNKKKIYGTDKRIPHIKKDQYPFINIQNRLIHDGYDISKIINEKNFDIFTLKDIIGYNNVLPFVGRIILENLGLIDEEILCVQKLDPFLIAVSNQYKPDVLYHNCLHGTDVTQSCYLFFIYSNVEKIAKTNVLDLLSIFIAALGHDIAHPGLTNAFHINDSTEIAITYNDISVLENFHASTLFKTIRKTETNIFEKLTPIDYKIIRKRMISEILATDMALHGKVLSLIKSKITLNEDGITYRLNLISGDEKTRMDEQQSLLDFMIHLADLAHNTRPFNISIKWVELLSEEFWRQGDIEREHNLPISFLCDRENINVPQSQKGFISGFILSTYEILSNIFPSLRYTYENANNNLKEWQKLMNEGRMRGWTPKKDSDKKNKPVNKIKLKRAVTKNFGFQNSNFLQGLKDKEEKGEKENKEKIDDKNIEENHRFNNSFKMKKHLNLDLETITEKNDAIKKSAFNPIITDLKKKDNNKKIETKLKTPSKKLPINDDSCLGQKRISISGEFKIIESKKDKFNIENKFYKYNDKGVIKKNAIKKKNCK